MARYVSSKVTINQSFIKRLDKAAELAIAKTAETIHGEIDQAQVVPRAEGTLSGENFFVDYSEVNKGTARLVNQSVYARRLYYHPEYNFHQQPWEEVVKGKVKKYEGNPNAKGKWYEDWLPGGAKEKQVVEIFEKFYKMYAGI